MEFYLSALLQALCFGPLVIGLYLSMKIFNIPDITTDGSYTFGAVLTAIGLMAELPLPITMLCALIGGGIAGSLTAIIHTKLKINPLLAGILIMTAFYSINLTIMGRSNLPLLHFTTLFDQVKIFPNNDYNILSTLLILAIVIIAVVTFLLKTDFGIAMRATGNNEKMVKALGVNTTKMKIIGLAVSNALVALSGFLMTQYQGFADINMGIGIVISGLGSVIVGMSLSTLFKKEKLFPSLLFTLGGAIIFQMVLAFTLSVGVPPSFLKLITAGLVLLIVAIPQLKVFSEPK